MRMAQQEGRAPGLSEKRTAPRRPCRCGEVECVMASCLCRAPFGRRLDCCVDIPVKCSEMLGLWTPADGRGRAAGVIEPSATPASRSRWIAASVASTRSGFGHVCLCRVRPGDACCGTCLAGRWHVPVPGAAVRRTMVGARWASTPRRSYQCLYCKSVVDWCSKQLHWYSVAREQLTH